MKTTKTISIRIGHSPDPDDAFMFYAIAHKKIDMRGFKVEHVIEDIESLNQRALQICPSFAKRGQGRFSLKIPLNPPLQKGEEAYEADALEVTAVSCHAYAYLADRYVVMRSGASVGDGYGPILVARGTINEKGFESPVNRFPFADISGKRIAIPGKLTTAYLVLLLFYKTIMDGVPRSPFPVGFQPVFVPFDKIFDAVRSGDADYGLVIHEGQITHAEHGMEKVLDLGAWWHEKTRLPLPLGIDIIRRDLGQETIKAFSKLFKESIEYALNHRAEALEYASQFGRGISGDLNDRFVAMYVNERTIDIGAKGEEGFRRLLDMAYEHKIISEKINLEFI